MQKPKTVSIFPLTVLLYIFFGLNFLYTNFLHLFLMYWVLNVNFIVLELSLTIIFPSTLSQSSVMLSWLTMLSTVIWKSVPLPSYSGFSLGLFLFLFFVSLGLQSLHPILSYTCLCRVLSITVLCRYICVACFQLLASGWPLLLSLNSRVHICFYTLS